jgi:hypothetical protein
MTPPTMTTTTKDLAPTWAASRTRQVHLPIRPPMQISPSEQQQRQNCWLICASIPTTNTSEKNSSPSFALTSRQARSVVAHKNLISCQSVRTVVAVIFSRDRPKLCSGTLTHASGALNSSNNGNSKTGQIFIVYCLSITVALEPTSVKLMLKRNSSNFSNAFAMFACAALPRTSSRFCLTMPSRYAISR